MTPNGIDSSFLFFLSCWLLAVQQRQQTRAAGNTQPHGRLHFEWHSGLHKRVARGCSLLSAGPAP